MITKRSELLSVFLSDLIPLNRGFFISAGLHNVLKLENFALDEPALDYLSMQDLFTPDFLKFLEKLRFTGDVWALPEGQLFFKDNPILEVTAPIIEAQLVETFIINQNQPTIAHCHQGS